MSAAAVFAAVFVALFIAHSVGDHWVQTSHQAAH
ncbi:transcriptional regulator, partial [Streptomyces sp. NPDC026672]